MPWDAFGYTRLKTYAAGSIFEPTDLNAIQDELGNEISTLRAAGQQAWQSVAMSSPWSGNVSYYKTSSGLVVIAPWLASLTSTVGATTTIAALPAGYRPGATVYTQQMFLPPNVSGLDQVDVTTAGLIRRRFSSALVSSFPASWAFAGPIIYRAEN